MASFTDLNTVAEDPLFRSRVAYAMVVSAVNVIAESTGTAGHAQRKAYAQAVLAGGYNVGTASLAVLTNSTIAAEATVGPPAGTTVPDGDIQFAVNSLWNALSGV